MGSIGKKLKSIARSGLEPITAGKRNYKANIPEVEEKARKRAQKCRGCLVDEPIPEFAVRDERIPELDKKMCSKCGCAAAYLMRQDVKKCEGWGE